MRQAEAAKENEIGPAVIEGENIVKVNATTEEVGIIFAAVEEKLELHKEDAAVVEPAVSSSTPVVETETSVESQLAKDDISATELVTRPIVEVEEAHRVSCTSRRPGQGR